MITEPLISVEWRDSKGVTSEWEFRDGLEPIAPVTIVSVGFLLHTTSTYITIAQSVSHEQVLGRLTIPKGAIRSTKELTSALTIIEEG